MELDYNAYFCEKEAEQEQMKAQMRVELEKQVDEEIASQIDVVCAFMRPRLIACWEKGNFGEDVTGEFTISLPEGQLSKIYAKTLNDVVRAKLFSYGFLVSFNPLNDERPEIARVYFNFTHGFYGGKQDWCTALAHEYLDAKVADLENTLHQVLYLHSLYRRQGDESPFGNKAELSVKLPPAARKIIAERICKDMKGKIVAATPTGKDKIVCGLPKV